MSVQDLTISLVSSGETVYDPVTVTSAYVQFQVTNNGEDDLEDLGLYVKTASDVGDVDYPADFPPATDYQDILSMGQATDLGLETAGGLYFSLPQNSGTFTGYITRDQGATIGSKIEFKDLPAGATETFSVLIETPPGASARRFFLDVVIS